MMTTGAPVSPQAARLSALAVGLAYSVQPDDTCISELLDASQAGIVLLREAEDCVRQLQDVEPRVRHRASRLLVGAVHSARSPLAWTEWLHTALPVGRATRPDVPVVAANH